MIAPSSTTDHFNFCAKYSQLSSVPSSPERRFKNISPCRRLFEDLPTNQNSGAFVVSNGGSLISNNVKTCDSPSNKTQNNQNINNKYNSSLSVTKDDNGNSIIGSNLGSGLLTTISSTSTSTSTQAIEGLTEILYSSYQRRKSLGGNNNHHNNYTNSSISTASPFMDDLGFLSSNNNNNISNNFMKKNSTIYEQENDNENCTDNISMLMSSPMRKPKECSIRKHWNRRIETISRRSMSECDKSLKMSENGLIHHLPSFDSPHDAIKRISPNTLIDLLEGKFSSVYDRLLVIDCRYPYEYEGGHIPTAINVNNPDLIENILFTENVLSNTVIVFHCEFSSERAPRMALHVRNLDRQHNKACYPALFYPEMYILDGGYKNYWQQHDDQCEPAGAYVPMRCPQYREQLRYHQKLKHEYKSGCHLSQHSAVKRLPPKSKKPRSKSLNIANARKFFNDLITAGGDGGGEEDLSFNSEDVGAGMGVGVGVGVGANKPQAQAQGHHQQHMFPSYTIPMVNSFSSIFASELDIPSEMDME